MGDSRLPVARQLHRGKQYYDKYRSVRRALLESTAPYIHTQRTILRTLKPNYDLI